MKSGLGTGAERAKRAEEVRRRTRDEARIANDALLEGEAFRRFLAKVADRAGYLCAEWQSGGEWMQGYRAALRDIVNGVVVNSSSGAGWLMDYAAAKAAEKEKLEKETEKKDGGN